MIAYERALSLERKRQPQGGARRLPRAARRPPPLPLRRAHGRRLLPRGDDRRGGRQAPRRRSPTCASCSPRASPRARGSATSGRATRRRSSTSPRSTATSSRTAPPPAREFDKLYALHKTDDQARRARSGPRRALALEDGDGAAACSLAKRLADEFPESRYVPCAREVCPTAPRGKRECADYILRRDQGRSGGAASRSRGADDPRGAEGGSVRQSSSVSSSSVVREVLVIVVVLLVEVVDPSSSASSSSSSRGSYLRSTPRSPELRLEELEELVHVVAAPLVEDVGQELEEVPAVDAALDLFDLLLGERLEDVFAQRLGVAFFDGIRSGEPDLAERTLVEMDLR